MKFRVMHVEGSKKGQTESYDVPVLTVGRDPTNVVAFDPVKDDRVSTLHARIAEQGGAVTLTDLGSRNGTLVNGQKVMGTVPLASGALVQFGDNGPMCVIHYEQAAAPAAAPPPQAAAPKKGGKGCLIAIVLLLVVVPCLGAVVFAAIFFMTTPNKVRVGGAGDNPPVVTTDPTVEPKGETPKEPEKPVAAKKVESPWSSYGVGSVFVQETSTHMEKPVAMDMKTTIKQTVTEKTDAEVTLKMEMSSAGTDLPATETKIPLVADTTTKKPEKEPDTRSETVEVPAGKFDCKVYKMVTESNGAKTTSESWMAKDVPFPVKTVVTSDTMTSTTVLTTVEKK